MNFTYIEDFSRSLKAFLLTKFFAYSQNNFAQFLINIYFWRITKNISFLVLFNIIFYLFHFLAYLPAGKISKEYNRFIPLRLGMILQLVYLFAILLLRERVVDFIIPVAIIGGIAHGAYWHSDNLLKLDLTNVNNRLKFVSVYSILSNIAGSLIPIFASILVISGGGLFQSYSRIFILAIIFAVLVFVSSFFISDKKKFESSKLDLSVIPKKFLKDRNIRLACWADILSYIANTLPLLLELLLYFGSGTELSLGSYSFITVLIAIITNFLMGKYLARKDYRWMLIYGGVINFALIFILFISQSYLAILIYGILTSLIAFMKAPVYPLIMDAFNMFSANQAECLNMRVEYLVLQELCVGIGNIVGLLVLLLLNYSMNIWLIGIVATIFAFTDLLANICVARIKDGKYYDIDGLN